MNTFYLCAAIVFGGWLIGEMIHVYNVSKRYREAKRRKEIIDQLVKAYSHL